MAKRILFIHGRGAQPPAALLGELWRQAVAVGFRRDAKDDLEVFESLTTDLFYFAHHATPVHKDMAQTEEQLRDTIDLLAQRKKSRDFRRRFYDELPGKSALAEFAMDVAASTGFGRAAMQKVAPEMELFWHDTQWREQVRSELVHWLGSHSNQDDELCIVSHCVGSVLLFDALAMQPADIRCLITMGSPLADRVVRSRLPDSKQIRANIDQWVNLSAEDDVMCHDKTLADDYATLVETEQVMQLTDHTIYNLALVDERSQPSHWAGYLVHPRLIESLRNFMQE